MGKLSQKEASNKVVEHYNSIVIRGEITQKDIIEKLGIDQSTFSQAINSIRPMPIKYIAKYCKIFNIDIDEFYNKKDVENAKSSSSNIANNEKEKEMENPYIGAINKLIDQVDALSKENKELRDQLYGSKVASKDSKAKSG